MRLVDFFVQDLVEYSCSCFFKWIVFVNLDKLGVSGSQCRSVLKWVVLMVFYSIYAINCKPVIQLQRRK